MPVDRRKDIPKHKRSAEALRVSRSKDAKKAAKAKQALADILFRHMAPADRQNMDQLLDVEIDLHTLYQAALVDLALLGDSLAMGLIEPDAYARRRLAYFDTLQRLGVAADKLSPPPATDLNCHVPPLEGGDDWFLDPETGEPLGREALNPPEDE